MANIYSYEMRCIHVTDGPVFLIEKVQRNTNFCIRTITDGVVDWECWCNIRYLNPRVPTVASHIRKVATSSRLRSIPGVEGVGMDWCSMIRPGRDTWSDLRSAKVSSAGSLTSLPWLLVHLLTEEEDTKRD